jgi:hypothetical protein
VEVRSRGGSAPPPSSLGSIRANFTAADAPLQPSRTCTRLGESTAKAQPLPGRKSPCRGRPCRRSAGALSNARSSKAPPPRTSPIGQAAHCAGLLHPTSQSTTDAVAAGRRAERKLVGMSTGCRATSSARPGSTARPRRVGDMARVLDEVRDLLDSPRDQRVARRGSRRGSLGTLVPRSGPER